MLCSRLRLVSASIHVRDIGSVPKKWAGLLDEKDDTQTWERDNATVKINKVGRSTRTPGARSPFFFDFSLVSLWPCLYTHTLGSVASPLLICFF